MSDTTEKAAPTIILAGQLIDGTGAEPLRDVALTVENGMVTHLGPAKRIRVGTEVLDLSEFTVLPGLINMHVHTTLPGDGTAFEDWMAQPDELLLLTAAANARRALETGVTTMRDCGGRGRLMFRLRDAIRAGIVPGPRFVLAGRALTITGGHCHYFGGEADGPDQMQHAARQLLKEGADFIKIMASGGGTKGTFSQFPAFEVDELSAAIGEAHKIGKLASCHCLCSESIRRALDAGVDHMEHCKFSGPDEVEMFDDELAHRLADRGVAITATLQVMGDLPKDLRERYGRGESSPEEAFAAEFAAKQIADHCATIGQLHDVGVPIVAGNDAGWRHTRFDDFYRELEYLVQAGLSPLEAIRSATGLAAEACQIDGIVGTLSLGRIADVIAVKNDPLSDVGVLRDPALVIQHGNIIIDRRS